jgi:hypothetical protein
MGPAIRVTLRGSRSGSHDASLHTAEMEAYLTGRRVDYEFERVSPDQIGLVIGRDYFSYGRFTTERRAIDGRLEGISRSQKTLRFQREPREAVAS